MDEYLRNVDWSTVAATATGCAIVGEGLLEFGLWRIRRTLRRSRDAEFAAQEAILRADQNRLVIREHEVGDREQGMVGDVRALVAEFRDVLDAVGTIAPEGWAESRKPLDRRLDLIDRKLDSKKTLYVVPA